jgi:hypothetical protein
MRLVGTVSLGDLALTKPSHAGDDLQSIAEGPIRVVSRPTLARTPGFADDQIGRRGRGQKRSVVRLQ